jgi:HEPN domain-containing protein
MIGPKEELVRSWLIKASRDLLSARELADGETSLLDTAAYHCQQAAEKAIKGYLLYHDTRFEKSHDIEVLIFQVVNIDPTFADCVESARLLTPLAVEYRYPATSSSRNRKSFKRPMSPLKRSIALSWPDCPKKRIHDSQSVSRLCLH